MMSRAQTPVSRHQRRLYSAVITFMGEINLALVLVFKARIFFRHYRMRYDCNKTKCDNACILFLRSSVPDGD